jgi:hypothetical protein
MRADTMMESGKKRIRQAVGLLQLLSKHALSVADQENGRICLACAGKPLMTLPASLLGHLQKEELVKLNDRKLELTVAGRAYLARQMNAPNGFLAQQQVTQNRRIKNEDGAVEEVTVHIKESPLAWLRLRRGKDGAPLLQDAQFAAGERLRADFTRAQLNPRITSSWDQSAASRQRGLPVSYEFSDGTLAAKKQVDEALRAVGPELNGVLLDVCCFLKGLKLIESERRWPARTAKIILSLALDRLAQHYGLTRQARGSAKSKIQHWGAEDYRPVILY